MSGYFAAFALLIPRTLGGEIVEASQIIHANGTARLTLRNSKDGFRWRLLRRDAYTVRRNGDTLIHEPITRSAYEFHSLLWERFIRGKWHRHACITARQFRGLSVFSVCEIHSLNPENGTAIIKVAEETDLARAPSAVKRAIEASRNVSGAAKMACAVQYSWVSWNMHANRKIAVLARCALPNEPYDG